MAEVKPSSTPVPKSQGGTTGTPPASPPNQGVTKGATPGGKPTTPINAHITNARIDRKK